MNDFLIPWLSSVAGALLADAFVRPAAGRAGQWLRVWQGLWLIGLLATFLFGVILASSGQPWLAAGLTFLLSVLVAQASNSKRDVLGEPLVFSDLALVGAMIKHPQFYFSVLALWQQLLLVVGLVAVAGALVWLAEPNARPAMYGAGFALGSIGLLALSLRLAPWRTVAQRPNVEGDVASLGLVPTLLLYWLRWRSARVALSARGEAGTDAFGQGKVGPEDDQLIVVVQCESFADPAELFASGGADLPALARARRDAVQWGDLKVSGFGAYTMRTEYGVLFGREEGELGFLLYDPYLTALDDPALALPQKLAAGGWRSVFVHPHDMRFYSRDQILPKAGFAELVGEDRFAAPDRSGGRYVKDADVADKILEVAAAAETPTLIYAVTMENHGPWAPHRDASTVSMVDNYNQLVLAGDAMLGRLQTGLEALGKPATLVFFGDHRPTIPGASDPGGDKHTPYVILRVGHEVGEEAEEERRRDLTPAKLHQAILDWGRVI